MTLITKMGKEKNKTNSFIMNWAMLSHQKFWMVNFAFTQMPTTFSTGHLLICEGESGQLRCNKEGKINVLSANYGRLDSHSCPHWMTTDTNCRSGNSFAQIQQICQSNSTCELEATNVFFGGDPCMGTYKYLFVEYQCQWHLTLRKFQVTLPLKSQDLIFNSPL